ncbi:flagellar type III secretion system pore protein FliP [Nitriliruptoraceae bacterium ZYF776]|nr:flagellar type III secretion system pore protein FliP [Profundirhabdus halotolerans]
MSRSAASPTRVASSTGGLRTLLLLVALLLAVSTWLAPSASAQPVDEPAPTAPEAPAAPTPPAAPEEPAGPEVSVTIDGLEGDESMSRTVTMVLLLTVAAVTPILLLLMTTFTRFVVVLGLARQGLGLQAVPPAQVLVGLALFLSLFSMGPTLAQVNEVALQPMLAGEMTTLEAAEAGFGPMRTFMLSQTREDDLALFTDLSGAEAPATPDDVGVTTLVPAFVISELRTAFTIGFVVFVPFLVIDLVVSSVLMALGMVMLPPIFVSLPIKLLLFVLVDGWALLSRSLVTSVIG